MIHSSRSPWLNGRERGSCFPGRSSHHEMRAIGTHQAPQAKRAENVAARRRRRLRLGSPDARAEGLIMGE